LGRLTQQIARQHRGAIIAGIQTMHMIKKGQLDGLKGTTSSAADKVHSPAF